MILYDDADKKEDQHSDSDGANDDNVDSHEWYDDSGGVSDDDAPDWRKSPSFLMSYRKLLGIRDESDPSGGKGTCKALMKSFSFKGHNRKMPESMPVEDDDGKDNDITLRDGTDDGKKRGGSSDDVRVARLEAALEKEQAKAARLINELKEEYYRSTKLAYELKVEHARVERLETELKAYTEEDSDDSSMSDGKRQRLDKV